MNSPGLKGFSKRGGLWVLEHLLFPLVIVVITILINNHVQAKKKPNLTAYARPHRIMKISEDNYEVKTPFIISNSGGSSTQNQKVTFLIPESETIDDIEMSEKHKSFYEQKEGGLGYTYVVFSITLPKRKIIEGSLIFHSNIEIPENSISPLNIIY